MDRPPKAWSIDRQVRAAWPDLLPTAGATDGPLDRLPASLRAGAQASASSSGESRLWSRRARCLTTWTSRSTAAPERADHLWCAPLSCPSPSNMAAHLLALASRVGRDAHICISRPLMPMYGRRRLDPLSGSWPPLTSSRLYLQGPGQLTRAHKVSSLRPSRPLRLRACRAFLPSLHSHAACPLNPWSLVPITSLKLLRVRLSRTVPGPRSRCASRAPLCGMVR